MPQNVLINKAKTIYKMVHSLVPQNIKDFFSATSSSISCHIVTIFSNQNFYIPKPNISLFKNSLSYYGPVIWNTIPSDIKNSSTSNIFTRNVVEWIANE